MTFKLQIFFMQTLTVSSLLFFVFFFVFVFAVTVVVIVVIVFNIIMHCVVIAVYRYVACYALLLSSISAFFICSCDGDGGCGDICSKR